MNDNFLMQYQLMQKSRQLVFDFLENEVGADLYLPVAAYADTSVAGLLGHVAACYINWLYYFPKSQTPEEDYKLESLAAIKQLYEKVDAAVYEFLQTYKGSMNVPITGTHNYAGLITTTPAQLFTHVLTHEFHHKGQIMLMCRMLGHIPLDTDVSNFFG